MVGSGLDRRVDCPGLRRDLGWAAVDTTELFRLADEPDFRSESRSDLRSTLLWGLSAASAALAVLRFAWDGGPSLQVLLLLVASVVFAAGGGVRGLSRRIGAVAPWLSLVLCLAVAWIEGGLYNPVLFWGPFLPVLATAFSAGRMALVLAVVAVVGIFGLCGVEPAWGPPAAELGLRAAALAAAVGLGAFVAVVQERDREARRKRLWRRVAHHPLTGLKSREFFMELLRISVDRASRGVGGLGLMFIDLDGLKRTNDALGHPAGDVLLRESACRIAGSTRAGDVVCHLGGDEFVVVVEPCPPADELMRLGHRVSEAMRAPILYENDRLETSASIGIAEYVAPESAQDLVRRADRAMYRVKHAGGDGVALDAARPVLALRRSR